MGLLMFDLHILIVSQKHASSVLFIFVKEHQRRRLLEIFLVIILSKNRSHVLQQQKLMSQLLSHELMDQAM